MTILFAVLLGLAVLYFWLSGHWFARLLMVGPLAFLLVILGANVAGSLTSAPALPWPVSAIIVALGIAAGWFLSGLPARHRPILYQPPAGARSWPPPAN